MASTFSNQSDEENPKVTRIEGDERKAEGDWGLRNVKSYPSWTQTGKEIYEDMSWSNPGVWLHILLLAIPLAWVSHFVQWHHNTTFVLCFVAMIPLQKIFDWGGEKLGVYLGKDLKDLMVITLSNSMEAALAVILLLKCELRLLQSTIIGVVLLHLLLVPGTAFFVQGAHMHEQKLDPNHNSLNQSLSMIGVLGILVPTIFFAALDRGDVTNPAVASGLPSAFVPLVSDPVRRYILQISRGIAIILPVVYVTSRLWRHRVLPGHDRDLPTSTVARPMATTPPTAPGLTTERNETLNGADAGPSGTRSNRDPQSTAVMVAADCRGEDEAKDRPSHPLRDSSTPSTSSSPRNVKGPRIINPWFCVSLILAAVIFMIPTAEFLVSSIEDVQNSSGIQTEWFGLILLPILSFSADGVVVMWKFSDRQFREYVLGGKRDQSSSRGSATNPTQVQGSTSGNGDETVTQGPTVVAVEPGQATAQTGEATVGTADTSEYEAELAHWRPIDLSIQFMLWWTPFLVLLGWWTGRPMHFLFDYFEVGLLLGACFLVNYVTVDAKTNVSEGLTMIAFYVMIATATWFYPGQPQVEFMLNCPGTVADAVAMSGERMR